MTGVYVVGEDRVTRAIIRRILSDYAPNLSVLKEEPVRGSQLKGLIPNFNRLSLTVPVVLLEDLDTVDCAPVAKQMLLRGEPQSEDFIINIAVDEAEAWLYADREGLSSYLEVPIDSIPQSAMQPMGGPRPRLELSINMKTSLHLTSILICQSNNESLLKQIRSSDGRCKGPEYNPAIIPFIENIWDPERARSRSYSLDRAINRIILLNNRKQ